MKFASYQSQRFCTFETRCMCSSECSSVTLGASMPQPFLFWKQTRFFQVLIGAFVIDVRARRRILEVWILKGVSVMHSKLSHSCTSFQYFQLQSRSRPHPSSTLNM